MKIDELFKLGWIPYMGQCEKEFYDIIVKNKKDIRFEMNDDSRNIAHHCWPNAGKFHSPDGTVVNDNKVLAIKRSEKQ